MIFDSRNIAAKLNTGPSMHSRSLFRIASRGKDSLAYIESIIDAYSQYFVNDVEHTDSVKSVTYHLFLSLEQVSVSFCMVFP